jgi:hypothetical protein
MKPEKNVYQRFHEGDPTPSQPVEETPGKVIPTSADNHRGSLRTVLQELHRDDPRPR